MQCFTTNVVNNLVHTRTYTRINYTTDDTVIFIILHVIRRKRSRTVITSLCIKVERFSLNSKSNSSIVTTIATCLYVFMLVNESYAVIPI